MLQLLPAVDLQVSLFKDDKCFDFITGGRDHFPKQHEALEILTDNYTEEVLYGGAAGGAKSWTACEWLLWSCLSYPGTKWFMGREELKALRKTTYQTFKKVCKERGVIEGEDFTYNGQDHFILFSNGSRIDLLDLKFLPSDELFERFGSLEFTGGLIEEGGEVDFNAYDTLKTRVGRHMNDEYGLIGKLLITANPKKNWLHWTFYKPWRDGKLDKDKRFLPSLSTDNPYNEKGYQKKLDGIVDATKRARLRDGDWDYADDAAVLCQYRMVKDIFTNDFVEQGQGAITADIARMGKDNTLIRRWKGWVCVERVLLKGKVKTTDSEKAIKDMATRNNIPMSRVVVDEDGVGGGVVDHLGCIGFVAASSPMQEDDTEQPNYQNLKTQCAFGMAKKVNDSEVWEQDASPDTMENLSQEFAQLTEKDGDDDRTLKIIQKKDMIRSLGRSPDDLDTYIMRYRLDLEPVYGFR